MTKNENAMSWRRHVADCQVSGPSSRAYAKRAGLTVSGLSYWRKCVAEESGVDLRRASSSPPPWISCQSLARCRDPGRRPSRLCSYRAGGRV